MAAQEYYNPGGAPQGPPQPVRPPQMQQQPGPPRPPPGQAPSTPPYPLSDAPPPYSAFANEQRPQSQPPPQTRIPQQNGGPQYQAYNPNQANVDTHQYPPEKMPQRPSTLQNMYRPSDFTSSNPPPQQAQPPPPPPPQNGYPQQPNGYFAPAGPGLSQIYNDKQRPPRRSSTSGYPTAQSPYRRSSRSRSRSRDRKHRHNHNRPAAPRQKSSGVNTFLGAGGGALLGDMIFPGLGTIGGAILGGVGGHEYGKKRASSNPSRSHNRRSANNDGDYYEDEGRRGRKY